MEVMEDKEVAFLQLLGASSHLRGADPQQQLQQSWKSSLQQQTETFLRMD